jgi:cytochrome P450
MMERVDLMAPEIRADPYPTYAKLRRLAPVCRVDPGGRWVIARYDDALQALKNPVIFSAAGIGQSSQPPWLGRNPFADSILFMDPPRHGKLRALVSRAFGGPAALRLETRIRSVAEALATELPMGRAVDFVEAFSMPLPAQVLSHLLGLDVSLAAHFKRWADDIAAIGAIKPDDQVRQASVRTTVQEMEHYLGAVLASRRGKPADDLVSDLIRAEVDGEALSDTEIMGFLFLLLVAGLETTVHLLSNAVGILADHPDVLARLSADPSAIPRFVEECLRFDPPVHGAARITTTDVELSGFRLPAHAPVVILLGSACRDDAHFVNADRFDMDREVESIPFGSGAHFCLGARLARTEARLALESLLPRLSRISRGSECAEWNASMIVRGPTKLPMVLE